MSAHALLACASLLLGASAAASWVHPSEVHPGAFSPEHNGGVRERLVAPAAGTRPHIWMLLFGEAAQRARPTIVPYRECCPDINEHSIIAYYVCARARLIASALARADDYGWADAGWHRNYTVRYS